MTRNIPKIIPKIIHQVWSNIYEPLPEFFNGLMETWKEHHPDWKYIFWDDRKMDEFMREFYPEYLVHFSSIKYTIQKWDILRYFIIYHYGGMYVDVDYECLESFNPLLENNKGCYFAAEAAQHADSVGMKHFFTNALMISVPHHPFIWLAIESAFRELSVKKDYPNQLFEVLSTTGPLLLTYLYNGYYDSDDIYILPPELVAPLSHLEVQKYMKGNKTPSFRNYIKNKLANAIAVHYFMATWYGKK